MRPMRLVEQVDFALQVVVALVLVLDHAVNMQMREQYHQAGYENRAAGDEREFTLFLLVEFFAPREQVNTCHISRSS